MNILEANSGSCVKKKLKGVAKIEAEKSVRSLL